jgi:hypothetical protein
MGEGQSLKIEAVRARMPLGARSRVLSVFIDRGKPDSEPVALLAP